MIPEQLRKSHESSFGLSKIEVYDNLLALNDLGNLHSVLLRAGYERTDASDMRHWATDISVDIAETMPIYESTVFALDSFRPSISYKLFAAKVNVSSYGDMIYSHHDCRSEKKNVTATWYICEKWNHEWGGETLFFDDNKDARAVVSPRPGRLALFDGDLVHAERPPNRICFSPKYTITLKFEPISITLMQ